jgi:tetratricopeptide (TPR) repeat protein
MAGANFVDYAVIALYALLMVRVGFYVLRFNRGAAEYFRGGSRIPWLVAGLSCFMAGFSARTFTGAAGVAYRSGVAAIGLYIGNALSFLLGYFIFAKRWRRSRITTVMEYLSERFNPATHQVFSWTTIVFQLFASASTLFGLSLFVSSACGFPVSWTILGAGALIVFYCVLGGLWAVVVTDFLQASILMPFCMVLVVMSLVRVGGVSGLVHSLPPEMKTLHVSGEFGWLYIASWTIMVAFGYNTCAMAQRYFTAQYRLGTLHFSRGLTDSALEEWLQSRTSNPQIPILDASLGMALLHEKHDAERALSSFRDGLQSDATNVTLYLGADPALSLLSKPASERVQVLEKYPNLSGAPFSLIFELILNLAKAGDFQRAESLFRDRFFPREEGGTNVRQVWVDVELQKMLASARDGHCADALVVAEHLGEPVHDLPFTHDGLESTLQSARTNYQLGAAYASCAKPEEAAKKFQLAFAASAPDQMVWAWRAAQKLPGFDGKHWQERLQTALAQAKSRSDTSSYTSWWDYTVGALAGALGSQQEADQRFQKALLLPDRMLSYHFTRTARAKAVP